MPLAFHQASHHAHHQLYGLLVLKSLLPRERVPRLELQRHPQGPIQQPFAAPFVSPFPTTMRASRILSWCFTRGSNTLRVLGLTCASEVTLASICSLRR